MKPGHIYKVEWVDICETTNEHPDKAKVTLCTQYVSFYGTKTESHAGKKIQVHVFRLAAYSDGPDQDGWIAIPSACVLRTRRIHL